LKTKGRTPQTFTTAPQTPQTPQKYCYERVSKSDCPHQPKTHPGIELMMKPLRHPVPVPKYLFKSGVQALRSCEPTRVLVIRVSAS